MIINVANILKPKKIRNYLIILNKIDRQAQPKVTIKKVKSIITNNVIKQLNLSDNIFISLDSRQLKHQTLMKENFEDYLFFLFNQYLEKSVIPFKDNREGTEEEKKFNTKLYSFNQFLIDYVVQGKNEEQTAQYIEEAESKFDDNYDYDELNIKDIFTKIKTQENFIINYDIDLEDENVIKLFKALYIKFKEKDNLPFSVNVNKVYEYFNNILDNLEKSFDDNVAPPPAQLISESFKIEFENFTKKFKRFHEENKNFKIIGELNNSFEQLYNYIENQRIIYVGIFGNSSTGKSVIYNNIFGTNILTVNENECTKRGIIIEDGESIAMYLANSETKELNGNYFNVFTRAERIACGLNDVKEKLEQFNTEYSKDTDNGDLDYFIITVPIKFFDEMNMDPEIRKSIKFIDLPGYNTSKSDNFAYTPVIESISCFLMTFKASSIGSEDNEKSMSIYKNLKMKSKRAVQSLDDAEFIKCCLFIINLWDKESPDESNLKDWTNTIKKFLINDFQGNIDLESNLSYLNALLYQNYLFQYQYFFNYQYLLEDMLYLYNNQRKSPFGKSTFIKFFGDTLKKKLKELFKIKDKEIKEILSGGSDKEIYNQMDLLFNHSYEITGFLPKSEKNYENYLKDISSYLSYGQKNIKNIPYYQNSYIEKFFKDLSDKIKYSQNLVDTDFREHLIKAIDIFNIFFNIDINNQNQEKKAQFMKESQAYYDQLKKCYDKYNFTKIFDDFIKYIHSFFNLKISCVDKILENNNGDFEKALNNTVGEFKEKVINFQDNIKQKYLQFIKDIDNIYNNLVNFLGLATSKDINVDIASVNIKAPVGKVVGAYLGFFVAGGVVGAVGGIFPPSLIVTIPALLIASFFTGKSLTKAVKLTFSKSYRLSEALSTVESNQIEEFTSIKERFIRDLEDKKRGFESNIVSLINIKTLEISSKTQETKNFYIQLKKDYENLYNYFKAQFNI